MGSINCTFLYPGLFWTAPETLREYGQDVRELPPTCRCRHGAGDMYAAGIILKEVFCRNEPYHELDEQYEPKGKVTRKKSRAQRMLK